jgi:NAD-dependent dihydropyrimidine dehydrogenase PreA subunit
MKCESVEVNRELCNGCGICAELCPLDNLRMGDDGFPYVKYDECWSCETCELECPSKAIKVVVPYLLR